MAALRLLILASALLALHAAPQAQTARQMIRNPQIDYDTFAANVAAVRSIRESRRITEAQFMRMAAEPGTVVLDARSQPNFELRHVAGARNLTFPEFTEATLARAIPSKTTRVLIYCNNNFMGAAESFAMKAPPSALNVSTLVSLYTYGYRNVYELGPAIDVATSKLKFAGTEVR